MSVCHARAWKEQGRGAGEPPKTEKNKNKEGLAAPELLEGTRL